MQLLVVFPSCLYTTLVSSSMAGKPRYAGDLGLDRGSNTECICEFAFLFLFLSLFPSPSDGNSKPPRPVKSAQVADKRGSICKVVQTATRPAGNTGRTR
ncbi:hypothetical protein QBC41DRAFT_61214 [Cercophora samala]|uniref:Secreted protein n=1 Tax=Cercophora samala TaxID=330535 RepID=A0AA39ZHX8_9PEZI|nr:hypothetical protein QBC41DRAFT_61214 [Cercophora samala]